MCTYSYCDRSCETPSDAYNPDAYLCDGCRVELEEDEIAGRDGDVVFCRVCWVGESAEQEAEARRLLNGDGAHPDDEDEPEDETTDVTALPDGRPCTVGGCGRVVGDCPHLAPAYVPASRRGAAA